MQLCADVDAVRQQEKRNEKLVAGFQVGQRGVLALYFGYSVVVWFHSVLRSLLFSVFRHIFYYTILSQHPANFKVVFI